MKKKHIVFYIPVLNTGGAEKVVINLLKGFKNDDSYNISLITDKYASKWIEFVPDSVNIKHLDNALPLIKRIMTLGKLVDEINPTCVISHLTHANLQLLLIKLILSFKLIIVEHSITSQYIRGIRFSRVYKTLIRCLFNRTDKIICVSKHSREDLIKNFNVDPNKCIVIYNPIDFENIENCAKESSVPQELYQKIASKPYFVIVGRIEASKNHIGFLRMFKNIAENMDANIVIVGDGSYRIAVLEEAKKLSLSNRVIFTGALSNPYKVIADSIALVLPSKYEGFGLVLIEGLFLGRHVISANFPAAYEVFQKVTSTQICKTEKDYHDAMYEAFKGEITKEAQKSIRSRLYLDYSYQNVTNRYMNLIEELF